MGIGGCGRVIMDFVVPEKVSIWMRMPCDRQTGLNGGAPARENHLSLPRRSSNGKPSFSQTELATRTRAAPDSTSNRTPSEA